MAGTRSTFGLQAQRMDADERERTYGSLATFGFSNLQTAGFGPTGTLDAASGNAYASFLLGELNATTVIEDSEVATSGRFYTYAFWAQDDFKLRPNLSLNLGLRYDIMKPYTELYDRWSFMDATMPNPAVGGLARRGRVRRRRPEQLPMPHADQDLLRGRRASARSGVHAERANRAADGLWHQLLAPRRRRRPRRRAQRHRIARLLRKRELPEPERQLRAGLQLERRRAGVCASAVFRSVAQRRLCGRPWDRRQRHLRRSRDRRAHAALSKLERRRSTRRRAAASPSARRTPGAAEISLAAAGAAFMRISSIRNTSLSATC